MRAPYISYPEPNVVAVSEEDVAPPGAGELLCQAERSLISTGTELTCLRGLFDPGTNWASWVRYPFRPGYSMVARVVAVGPGVEAPAVGQRVLLGTPHQALTLTAPDQAYPVPEGISAEEATWGILACTTQLAVRRAELALGETVGVVGLGLLGQLIVQYAALSGARRVVAIDPVPLRLEAAAAHGATDAIAGTAAQARDRVAEITHGRMLDAVWDVTGHPAVLSQCVQLLRPHGRVVLTGDTPTPTQQVLGPGVLSDSISVLGVHGNSYAPHYTEVTPWTRREIIALFFDFMLQGRMRVADLITHRYRFDQAPDVYQRLREDRTGAIGVILEWSQA